MRIFNILTQAINFDSVHSRKNFFSFLLKALFYIIPAIILGNYTDITVKKTETHQLLGDNLVYYILLQTFIIISTLYFFLTFFSDFVSEFTNTIPGTYFIVLYFGMQTNYIYMLKEFFNQLHL